MSFGSTVFFFFLFKNLKIFCRWSVVKFCDFFFFFLYKVFLKVEAWQCIMCQCVLRPIKPVFRDSGLGGEGDVAVFLGCVC